MDQTKKQNRARRSYTDEFKAGAVALVLDEEKTVAQVARDLDLTASALSGWVERARADRSNGKTGLTTAEREELLRLRKENRVGTHGITCSMSRRGNCLDNAAMESWNSTLKSELGEHFGSHAAAKAELFDYIEIFYNQQRRHSSLGYLSPAQYERVSKSAAAA